MEAGLEYSGVGCSGVWRGTLPWRSRLQEDFWMLSFSHEKCYLLSSQQALAALD